MSRNIAVVLLVLFLSVPAFSQQPSPSSTARMPHYEFGMMRMWGMASDQEIDRGVETLRRTLNLSESQVTGIRKLAQTRRDSFRPIREQAKPKVDKLTALLSEKNPDPAAVGRLVVDLKAIHQQVEAKQADLEKQLSSLLNPAQRQIVDNLRSQVETLAALRSIGLLGVPGFHRGMLMSRWNEGL